MVARAMDTVTWSCASFSGLIGAGELVLIPRVYERCSYKYDYSFGWWGPEKEFVSIDVPSPLSLHSVSIDLPVQSTCSTL